MKPETKYITKVIPIKTGISNCFLIIQNSKFFLVDTGEKGFEDKIAAVITSRGLKLKDLQFIFLTHTHYDHAGSAYALKKLTGASIVVHESEIEYLIDGFHPMTKGTSPFFRLIITLSRLRRKSKTTVIGVKPDIIFSNSLELQKFGFDARIIHTPGHTKGSSCLIIDKHTFVGDTMFNVFGNIYPPFANDTKNLIKSWELLLSKDAKYYYPAHGKRITKSEFKVVAVKKAIPIF